VEGVTRRACEYAVALGAAVPSAGMALAEFPWRNGWFLAQEQAHALSQPLHRHWLHRAAVPTALIRSASMPDGSPPTGSTADAAVRCARLHMV
jgi:hypothetical protein